MICDTFYKGHLRGGINAYVVTWAVESVYISKGLCNIRGNDNIFCSHQVFTLQGFTVLAHILRLFLLFPSS